MAIETRANTNYKVSSTDIIESATRFVSKEYVILSAPVLPAYLMDTSLWGWGNNAISGADISNNRSSPVQNVIGGINWKNIQSTGTDSVVAINKSGQLWIWGNNNFGKLGDNSTTHRSSPVQTIAGGSNWKQAGTSYGNSIGVKTDGTLWAWGHNSTGAVGDNSTTHRSSPVQTIAGGSNWKQAATGNTYCGAIKVDGSLWMWGRNDSGQLGDNTTSNRSSPVQTIAQGNNWRQLSCGENHTAVIKDDGTLWLWGDNTHGQLGDGTKTNRSSPVQTIAGGNNWKSVSCGAYYTTALKIDGTLWLWGHNQYGKLGTNNTTHRSSPVQTIAEGTDWVSIAAGSTHTTAIKNNGYIWAWGFNSNGELGDNSTTHRSSPVQVVDNSNWIRVIAALNSTIAIKDDTQVDDTFFSINNVDTDNLFVRKKFVDEGHVWAWGHNSEGNLGDNSTTHRSSPVQLVSTVRGWKELAISKRNGTVLGIKEGNLYSWGNGTGGTLGNSTTTNRSSPVVITGSRKWKRISVGGAFAAAIEDNGSLWAWGENTFGQLGTNNTTNTSSPVQSISTDINWKQVSCGNNFVAAIKTDNSLWVWGQGTHGQLGNNSTTHRSSPVQTILTEKTWKKVSSGGDHVAAIKTDGTLWAWGENAYGQLGVNDTTQRSSPVQTVADGNNWREVSSGFHHIAAIKNDGTLWVWGHNSYGQLGDNTTIHRSSPVQTVAGGTDWKYISAGQYMTAAIKTNDTLWVWGHNSYGQLGDNTTIHRSSPVQIVANTSNWKSVVSGSYNLMAIRDTIMSGVSSTPAEEQLIITDTSLTSMQVPGNFNPSNNSIQVIGGGAHGGSTGGGGGAWAKKTNVNLTPGQVINIQVGNPNANTDTWVDSSSTLLAKGAIGATGGQASASVGDLKYSGGNGVNGGGGAAGSPDGNGASGNGTGGSAVGTNQGVGGSPVGGTGSTGTNACNAGCTTCPGTSGGTGGTGGSGTAGITSGGGGAKGGTGGTGGPALSCSATGFFTFHWTQPAGPQGVGGNGGAGGTYGGGGGAYGTGSSNGTQGQGAQGAIILRWQPTF